ncbi:MAG: hypothetical protein NC124_13910 [Clostridium sp.]|nr:hypothetical protein [Clostridium sp.]
MSEKIWYSIKVCRYRFKDKIWNKRFFYTGIAFVIFLYMIEEGIRRFAVQVGVNITPWIFPFLSSDWICQMIISGYYIWIVSALCGNKEEDLFIRARAGESAWQSGSCMSMIKSAFVYVLCLILSSAILLAPYLEFSFDWGIIWNTLARTNAGQQYLINISISPVIIHLHTPIEAFACSILLQFLCLSWLGMLMYFVNTLTQKAVGTYIALAFVFLDVMLANTSLERFYRYSPVTLAQLSNYSMAVMKYGIDFIYAVKFYLTGIVVFWGMSVLLCGRRRRNGKQN